MSRFLYWTIVLGTEPTSFRASEADELLPTLTQLRRKHPDASLRWFQRGRLWLSPDDAKAALARERSDARGRPATWRPGGKHVDPRQKYIDAKKAKWTPGSWELSQGFMRPVVKGTRMESKPFERVVVNCREHLQILDAIEADDHFAEEGRAAQFVENVAQRRTVQVARMAGQHESDGPGAHDLGQLALERSEVRVVEPLEGGDETGLGEVGQGREVES